MKYTGTHGFFAVLVKSSNFIFWKPHLDLSVVDPRCGSRGDILWGKVWPVSLLLATTTLSGCQKRQEFRWVSRMADRFGNDRNGCCLLFLCFEMGVKNLFFTLPLQFYFMRCQQIWLIEKWFEGKVMMVLEEEKCCGLQKQAGFEIFYFLNTVSGKLRWMILNLSSLRHEIQKD